MTKIVQKWPQIAKNPTWALVGLTMSICGLRMTNPAEEALDMGVPTADVEDDRSVCGESAKGEKNPAPAG